MKRGGYLKRNTPLRRRTRLRLESGRELTRRQNLELARYDIRQRCKGYCEAGVATQDPELLKVCTGYGQDAHHILRRSQGGSDDASNLLWICRGCHAWIHANPARAYALGLLARSAAGRLQPPIAKGTASAFRPAARTAERPAAGIPAGRQSDNYLPAKVATEGVSSPPFCTLGVLRPAESQQ